MEKFQREQERSRARGTAHAQAGMEAWCGDDIDPFRCGEVRTVQENGVTRNSGALVLVAHVDALVIDQAILAVACARSAHEFRPVRSWNPQTIKVAALDTVALAQAVERLAQILQACVHEGASIGFIMPFERNEARAYWLDRVAAPHAAGGKIVLLATLGEETPSPARRSSISIRCRASVITPRFRKCSSTRPFAAPESLGR